MIDLTKKVLSTCVEVDGIFYKVETDFRYWLRVIEILGDKTAKVQDVEFIFEDKIPENKKEMISALVSFAYPRQALPRVKDTSDVRVLDYTIDAALIYAAFFEMYGIDLLECDLHYYKFLALLNGLHGTKLNDVMGYRSWQKSNKSFDDEMSDLRDSWALSDVSCEDTEKEREAFNAFFD